MPNGRTHDIITFVILPVVVLTTYILTKNFKILALITAAYLFASLMFNGDLDIDSKPYNRWWVFKMIWIPYQLSFEHRSIFTHGYIIGTVVRLVYIGIIPFIILLVTHHLNYFHIINLHIFFIICIGLELGSAVHTAADKIF